MRQLALRCYPPSWQQRYGAELDELSTGKRGVTLDLLVGAVRAWAQPLGGRSAQQRRASTIGTVHISWCFAFVAGLVYLKQVNDPPLPGLTIGLSQPLWGVLKGSFFLGWMALLVGGSVLLLRVCVPALRRHDWHVLRPMFPASLLLVIVLGSLPFVGSYGYGVPSIGPLLVVLAWLGLGVLLVIAGAIGPVVTLRRSGVELTWLPVVCAGIVTFAAIGLAVGSLLQAAVLSRVAPLDALVPMWGAVILLAAAAATSTTSLRRSLFAGA